jgi:peptidoglycan/xylan/chitin deacetylase (PgdA/CDA1 family)
MLVVKKVTKKRLSIKKRLAAWPWHRWMLAAFVLIFFCGAAYLGMRELIKARTFQFFGQVVGRVETDEKVVALTFDDGPLPGTTRQLLDILKHNNAKATFYELGKNIAAHPELTRAVVASGNEIGNHSYSHNGMAFMSPANVAKEIETTDVLLRQNGYTKTTTFRPPYGDKLFTLPHYLAAHDRVTIMFDLNPDDQSPAKLNPSKILTDVLAHVQPGSIIVMHPEYKERISSLQAVEPIIKHLQAQGYRFITISELLQYQAK